MSRKVNSLDAKTLYDYDDKDRLTMVVPPDATSASSGLIFTYAYDAADRMTQKKVPDANAVNMTYNVRDLLAFVQDGNLAAQSKYLATQYDDYGRDTKSGFSTSTANPSAPTFSEVLAENFYDGHDGVSQVINLTTNPQYRGRIYKSKTKVLGSSNDWISKVHTYDTHGRTTNTTGNNHLTLASSNTEVFNLTYDWADNLLTENRSHSNGTALTFNQRRGFEHQGRLYDYFVNIAGTEKHTARYGYNARNELTERNIHYDTYGGTGAWLQSVDYAYNDQGWLTTINSPTLGGSNIAFPTCTSSVVNPGTTTVGQDIDTKDLFYMQLQYDVLHSGLSGTLRKDGNISQAVWRVRGRQRQAYSYSYDGLQRISTASYSDINDAGTVTASNRYNTSYTYADLRGNISNLQRNGLYLNGACFTQALMDNLTYTHTSGTNKISSISDAAMSTQGGFRAASGGYTYDANGNMLTNGAKGITSISYNHLNLPTNITITGGKTIDFTYAADGTKLRKVVKTGATINLVMEYVNGVEYRGTVIPATTLEAVYFSEGRMYNSSGTWKREYVIKDHLGNTRIAYCDINGDGVIAVPGEILQENNYDAFGFGLDGVYMNHTNSDNLYQYNGKELNGDHGLNWLDYGARWYDGSIGRWHSVDPMSEEMLSWSPFNYGFNNPIKYIDPDGNTPITGLLGAGIGALIGGGIEAGRQLYKDGKISDWKSVGGSAVQGLITGGVAGLTGGASLLTTVAVSSGSNVVGGAINNTIQGKENTIGTATTDAAIGVGAGLAGKILDKVVRGASSSINAVIDEKRVGHIFRDAEGHFPKDTPGARDLLNKTANKTKFAAGTDKYGNQWSTQTLKDGTQVWTQTRNGKIVNGGINQEPRSFNKDTGLSSSKAN